MFQKKQSSYETLVVINMVCLLLFLWKKQPVLPWIALLVDACCLLIPFLREQLHRGWTIFFHWLGRINAWLLLSLVYFLLLLPVALISRLFRRKISPTEGTRFTTREHAYVPEDFQRPG